MKLNFRPVPGRPDTREYTYNLFINKRRPEIFCAVPEDRPVPGFLEGERWSFVYPVRPSDAGPPGFDDKAARAGARFNGFYLFQQVVVPRKGTIPHRSGPIHRVFRVV